ncbi:MAG TPA: hypothetical protein VFS24_21055 [Steroidobacteraceae bacterium]|nr:hypothetical protein [Steroidobacteraceae bacterium]
MDAVLKESVDDIQQKEAQIDRAPYFSPVAWGGTGALLSASFVKLHHELAVLEKCVEPLLGSHASHGVEQGFLGLTSQSGFQRWMLTSARRVGPEPSHAYQ